MTSRPNLRQRKVENLSYDEIKSSNDDAKRETVAAQGWGAFAIAFAFAVVLMIVVLFVIPSPIDPIAFSLPDPPRITGKLTQNEKLSKLERLYENEIIGPESLVIDGDHLYTGTLDGKILDIHKGKARVLAKLGQEPCGGFENEPTCGRPLGMRLDKDGYLIVADAYLGLFKINVATGDVHQLYSSTEAINGKTPKFLNDLDIAKDGTIYITDSSTKWERRNNRYAIMEAETSGRYYLQGEKKGQLDVFLDNLAGFPDNIRRSGRGTYWIAFAGVRFEGMNNFVDFTSTRPLLRSLFAKVFPQDFLVSVLPKYCLIIEIDENGNIIQSLHDPTGRQLDVSEVEEKNGVLYLGSYRLLHLGRLYMMAV